MRHIKFVTFKISFHKEYIVATDFGYVQIRVTTKIFITSWHMYWERISVIHFWLHPNKCQNQILKIIKLSVYGIFYFGFIAKCICAFLNLFLRIVLLFYKTSKFGFRSVFNLYELRYLDFIAQIVTKITKEIRHSINLSKFILCLNFYTHL